VVRREPTAALRHALCVQPRVQLVPILAARWLAGALGSAIAVAIFVLPGAMPLGAAATERMQVAPTSGDAALASATAAYQAGDLPLARERFGAAAQRGNRLAQFNLAVMLVTGAGGDPDPAQGVAWLKKAAAAGLVQAQYSLAVFYEHGEIVERSLTEATAWYRKAAEGGSRDAQLSLATQYFLGRGAPLDMTEAARWYERAAAQGDEGAQYIIASMYEKGDGVARDLARAMHWYRMAADQGDRAARIKADEMAARLGTR
jgi:TPR repeat protein